MNVYKRYRNQGCRPPITKHSSAFKNNVIYLFKKQVWYFLSFHAIFAVEEAVVGESIEQAPHQIQILVP